MKEEEKLDGGTDVQEARGQSVDLILPEINFPWAKVVHKLPQSSKGEGWVQFSDLHHHMPLSLWLIMVKVYRGSAVSAGD